MIVAMKHMVITGCWARVSTGRTRGSGRPPCFDEREQQIANATQGVDALVDRQLLVLVSSHSSPASSSRRRTRRRHRPPPPSAATTACGHPPPKEVKEPYCMSRQAAHGCERLVLSKQIEFAACVPIGNAISSGSSISMLGADACRRDTCCSSRHPSRGKRAQILVIVDTRPPGVEYCPPSVSDESDTKHLNNKEKEKKKREEKKEQWVGGLKSEGDCTGGGRPTHTSRDAETRCRRNEAKRAATTACTNTRHRRNERKKKREKKKKRKKEKRKEKSYPAGRPAQAALAFPPAREPRTSRSNDTSSLAATVSGCTDAPGRLPGNCAHPRGAVPAPDRRETNRRWL